jgi:hypothetical protein
VVVVVAAAAAAAAAAAVVLEVTGSGSKLQWVSKRANFYIP